MLFLTCFYLLGVFGSTPGLLKVPSAFPSSEGQCWEHSGLMMVVIKIVPEIGWWHSAITTAFTGFLFWCNIPVLFGRKQKHPFFLLLNKYFCLFICHLPFSSIYELLRKTEKKTRGKRERDNGEENNTSFCYSEAFFFFFNQGQKYHRDKNTRMLPSAAISLHFLKSIPAALCLSEGSKGRPGWDIQKNAGVWQHPCFGFRSAEKQW